MDFWKAAKRSIIVPVVVIDDAEKAVPTAQALVRGGIEVMEITYRTDAASAAISNVCSACPDIIVGAGTIVTLEQCKQAVTCGAKFIVSPGFDNEVVSWCVANRIPVIPGCVTPTEIMKALKYDLRVLKFFPANVYGGLTAMKSLSAPFSGITFIPTGGVGASNISEYCKAPFIYAVGGSWLCARSIIADENYEKITQLCQEARNAAQLS